MAAKAKRAIWLESFGIADWFFASAFVFVLHHFFALWFLGFSLSANLLACFGLFVGGAAFSWLYVRYRSIWIPYITHALCDVVVFGVGYFLLFG